MTIGDGKSPAISLPKGDGIRYTLIEAMEKRGADSDEDEEEDDDGAEEDD